MAHSVHYGGSEKRSGNQVNKWERRTRLFIKRCTSGSGRSQMTPCGRCAASLRMPCS